MKKEFLLIDVLHVATNGSFCTSRHTTDELVKFMIGKHDLTYDEYEKISQICGKSLLKKFSWIDKELFSKMTTYEKLNWYHNFVKENGEFVEVQSFDPKFQDVIINDIRRGIKNKRCINIRYSKTVGRCKKCL